MSSANTQYLPPVPPPQHPLAAKLAAMLASLTPAQQAELQAAIALVARAQPATYPP
jgi:hypothetical protein